MDALRKGSMGRWIAASVLTLAAAGCGGGGGSAPAEAPAGGAPAKKDSPPAAPTPAPATAAARPAALDAVKPVEGAGVIVGWVGYQGPPHKPRPISFGGEQVCAKLHPDKPPLDESLVVNANGTVRWALVAIKGNVPGDFPAPEAPVILDQVGCIFVPHVAVVRVGQEVEYRNSDPVTHNIRGNPRRNSAFNSVFAANVSSRGKFDTPEVGIQLKCDIHFWMNSYLHVIPHPFFAVTGEDGSFVIAGVPPGKHTLQLWHESLKPQTVEVEVKAGEVKEVPLTLSKS